MNGQNFHQYQQNEQPPLTSNIEHKKDQVLAWDRHKNMTVFNQGMG
jgi:hypothetical protein